MGDFEGDGSLDGMVSRHSGVPRARLVTTKEICYLELTKHFEFNKYIFVHTEKRYGNKFWGLTSQECPLSFSEDMEETADFLMS